MSVIIRLQNLPWSANAMDIRNFFRGLSIPEGGVHIVGGELGDAFIAFSTDEDARQGMMLDGGKLKEIQVKLLLSSRSEMHKVIEAARQSVPVLALQAPAPAPVLTAPLPPSNGFSGLAIPGLGNPLEIPQPAVIEPPAPVFDTPARDDDRSRRSSKEQDRRRTRSRSRDKKDRPKKDRRDRSRSRDRSERRRRDRSRSRDRRDRRRDRKDRSRSRDRSHDRSPPPPRRSRSDRRSVERHASPQTQNGPAERAQPPPAPEFSVDNRYRDRPAPAQAVPASTDGGRFSAVDQGMIETFNRLQELGKIRNPNAFQGEMTNGTRGRGPGGHTRRDGRPSRFDTESQEERECCVAVRGAPTHTSYGDVRRFFPFAIDKHGIKMINDSSGRRSGTIYVRFCDARSRHLALQQHPPELKGAAVAVEPLDELTYNNAIDSYMPYRADNDAEQPAAVFLPATAPAPAPLLGPTGFTVLRLSDLPPYVKEHDIVRMFSQYSLLSISLGDGDTPRTRAAVLHFVKPEDARDALQHQDRYVFGRRQATVTVLDERDVSGPADVTPEQTETLPAEPPRDPRQRRPQPQMTGPGGESGAHFAGPQFGFSGGWGSPRAPPVVHVSPQIQQKADDEEDDPLVCTLMKGLPAGATDRSIVEFLSDTGAVPARIHLMLNSQGLPSGDCFCEFRSEQEARRAASKHGADMSGCRVSLDLVTRTVVEDALEGPRRVPPPVALAMSSLSAPTFDNMIDDGRNHYDAMPRRGGFRPYRGRGGYDRGGFERPRGGYEPRGGFDRARGIMRRGMGYERGGYDRGGDRGRGFDRGGRGYEGRGYEGRGRGRGVFRGRAMYESDSRGLPEPDADADPALQDFGAPGCVLCLENVPFRATVDDLLEFFGDFELTQDDVIRRFNERGQPTGDARVSFRTTFDAQRALTTRNMATIHDRRISLRML